MNELEELEQEELDAKMLETPSPVVSAPNVPNHMPGKDVSTGVCLYVCILIFFFSSSYSP